LPGVAGDANTYSLMKPVRGLVLSCGLVLLAACAVPQPRGTAAISGARILDHIKVLASDDFDGRLPGTQGEAKSVAYISAQFKAMGLAPGNPDGSYVQDVPLVGVMSTPLLTLTAGGRELAMQHGTDFVATTSRFEPQVSISDSPLVFVGYGVQAPEYGWDDYKGLDVHGKTLIMLVNDPPVPDPQHPDQLDEKMFKGRAMTYYGRWTYKFEIASRLGADGVLIVHETEPAGYGWNVVQHSWSGEQFGLESANGNADRVAVQGWITLDKARELFARSGQDFDALKAAARTREFRPVPLDARISVTLNNTLRKVRSQNVLARLTGSDPKRAREWVIYTAHWDHLGSDPRLRGDQIFNGAADNASGVAGLLEIARRFASTQPRPPRSVLFMAVTAEEQGLLGSAYYVSQPLYPLTQTLADINMDVLQLWGRTRDVQVVGSGESSLEDALAQAAARQHRVVVPEDQPEKGHYFRSDQFSFARAGVPGLKAIGGIDVIGKPAGYGQARRQSYLEHDYHSPSDEVKPDWDLSGAAEDMELLYAVGRTVASEITWPDWRPGSEFRSVRAEALRTAPEPTQ
jgi:Zn-dependent M28 family amino/carboxypeptidase